MNDSTVNGRVVQAPMHAPIPEGEAAARGSNLHELILRCRDALVLIDEKSRIILLNPAGEEMFGYTMADVYGHRVSLLMPEPYANQHAAYVERYEREGTPRVIGGIRQVVGKRANGEEFPCELSVTPLGPSSEARYAAFIRDVSERERLHRKLMEKERLAALGMGASVLAHEIANPLNNMLLEAGLIERRLSKAGADGTRARMGRVMREIRRLVALLEEYRNRSRSQPEPRGAIDLPPLCDRVLKLHVPSSLPLRVERDFASRLPPVAGNSDKVEQVLVNLIKNSVEAMPDGGTLRLAGRQVESSVELAIQDSGPGLHAEVDAFQAFFTTKPGGTGLGLSIVREVVTSLGGGVRHERPASGGARFVLSLPVHSATERRPRIVQ